MANKTDKLGPNALKAQLRAIQERVGHHPVLPLSAQKNTGIGKLGETIEGYIAAKRV